MNNRLFILSLIACLFFTMLSASIDSDRFFTEAYLEDARVLDPDLQGDWCAFLMLKSKDGNLEIPIRREWRHRSQAEQDVERLKFEFSNQVLNVCLEDVLESRESLPEFVSDEDPPCTHVFHVMVSNSEGSLFDGLAEKLTVTDTCDIWSYPQVISYEKVSEDISAGWLWTTHYTTYLIELNDGTMWNADERHDSEEVEKESFVGNVPSQLCIGDYVMLLKFRDGLYMISLGSEESPKREISADIFDQSHKLVTVTQGICNDTSCER